LGDPQTLHYKLLIAIIDTIVAINIGRSLHLIPKQKAFSFVQQIENKWLIRSFNPQKNTIIDITESQPESEHYNAWLSENTILESRNSDIFSYSLLTKEWKIVNLPNILLKRNISRMAIKGNKIAIVIEE
jgi:hypothetical protein